LVIKKIYICFPFMCHGIYIFWTWPAGSWMSDCCVWDKMRQSFVICSDYGMMQVTSKLQQNYAYKYIKVIWIRVGNSCQYRVPTKLNACLVMLDIVLIFMFICHIRCHRDNEQFMVHIVVNYTFVNFVMRCIIQRNQNTNLFLMCYNKCDYYFGHCASPRGFYIYIYKNSVLVNVTVWIVRNTFWCSL